MDNPPIPTALVLEALEAHIAEQSALLAEGDYDGLPATQEAASLILQGLAGLNPEDLRPHAEAIARLTAQLDALRMELEGGKQALRKEMERMEITQRATHAYRNAKG